MKVDEFDNQQLDDLTFALRSRVLGDEEFAEVERLGIRLYLRWQRNFSGSASSHCYKEDELIARLNADLLQQFRLRAIANQTAL